MKKNVFLVAGGTGGHLFPALALGEELKKRKYSVSLITDTRCLTYLPKNLEFDFYVLSLGSLKSSIFAKLYMIFKMLVSMIYSISLFVRNRPSVVIGFGGYTAFPSLCAAAILRIPIMIHEQNCFLGKVNKIFAKISKRIALNFSDTHSIPNGVKNKIVVTGNPVRKEILDNVRDYNPRTKKDELNILVVGGSQSARIFSSLIPDVIRIIKDKLPKLDIFITQQATTDFKDALSNIYSKLCNKYEISEFFSDMPQKYNDSDIIICRSGASTIAELITLGRPAIMIPLPTAADNHQFYNAKFLENQSAGWCFEQSIVTPEILANKIIEIVRNKLVLQDVSMNLSKLRLNSSCILADTVDEIIAIKV